MTKFILILVFLLVGIVARRATGLPRARIRILNTFILWVSLPAVIFRQLPEVFENDAGFTAEAFCLAGMPWAVFAFTAVVTWLVGRKLGWSKATTGAISLTAGLGNTSFVGFPLLEALIGPEALKYGIVVDQPGTFLVLSTAGIALASFYSTKGATFREGLMRMVTFPPLVAVVLTVIWGILELPESDVANEVFEYLGMTLAPLALVSVGWQLEFSLEPFRTKKKEIAFGLAMKMLIAPILVYAVGSRILDPGSLGFHVLVLEAAMAPMITAAVVAQEMDLDGELAQILLGVGILISLVTVPIWWLAIG